MSSIRFLKAIIFMTLVAGLVQLQSGASSAASPPLTITDSGGKKINLKQAPKRVVSLVPGATEVFFALGTGDLIVGLTYHDTHPREAGAKTIVGGFFNPSAELIEKLKPDVILLSSFQDKIRQRFADSKIALIQVDAPTIEAGFSMIELLGKLADKNEAAAALIKHIKQQFDLVSRKVAKIPEAKRKRVMRLMGSDTIMTPGADSFQNELIRIAGGIPPSLGKSGQVVPITLEEWTNFNPQLIYYCGNEWQLSKKLFDKPGWKDVEAVRNTNYVKFPCELTCRASVNMGNFVSWLAGAIYPEELGKEGLNLARDGALRIRPISLDLPYIKSAQVIDGVVHDFPTQTLVIDFVEPMSVVNTFSGSGTGITTVGNHYFSPPLWRMGHGLSLDALKENVCKLIDRAPETTSLLYTGAKMENLSVQRMQFKDLTVYAFVTAGVETNAIRSAVDEGKFYEPGTINVIILTNMCLTPRAQTRAIISATEAKSAALQDLDIRSSYSPRYQATGTGTDEVLVVEGIGKSLDNAGGHSKLGELISKAVYAGVKESISLQNGLVSGRSVFQRLSERKIDLYGLVMKSNKFAGEDCSRIYADLEMLLLEPQYAGFMETAFAAGDAFNSGVVRDLQLFQDSCKSVSKQISGAKVDTWIEFVPEDTAVKPIRLALDALLNGLYHKKRGSVEQPPAVGASGQ